MFLVISCGRTNDGAWECTFNGVNCQQDPNSTDISEPKVITGPAGKDGTNGKSGETGAQGDKGDRGEAGESGTEGAQGNSGVNGQNGSDGTNGTNGNNGYSTLIELIPSTTCNNGGTGILTGLDFNRSGLIDLGDINVQSTDICNGENGANGEDAPVPAPYTPVSVIDPCGDKSGVFDEILLRLSNNQILASFSDNANGQNTRFSLLIPGSYMTTDGSHCYFSVDNNGNIVNEHY